MSSETNRSSSKYGPAEKDAVMPTLTDRVALAGKAARIATYKARSRQQGRAMIEKYVEAKRLAGWTRDERVDVLSAAATNLPIFRTCFSTLRADCTNAPQFDDFEKK